MNHHNSTVGKEPKNYGQPLYTDTVVSVVLIGLWSFTCGMFGSMLFYAIVTTTP